MAIVENQKDEMALIRAVVPDKFLEQERELLILAKKWIPRLPFQQIDLLIVDKIGKNISGTGMDTNVIGRKHLVHPYGDEEYPKITRIYVRDLTEESHGNALGVGLADYTHARLVNKINIENTYENCITGDNPRGAAVPLHYDTDREVLNAALKTVGCLKKESDRVIRVRNTSDLQEVMVSEAYMAEIKGRNDLEIVEGDLPIEFDEDENLLPF